MSVNPQPESSPIIIKKYANRRLYNTATSSYVTLENLSVMVRQGSDFIVYDAKTGEDITRSVLTQIIVEEEQKGENLLPISFLRNLIGLYGNNMQWMVPAYLESTMKAFQHNQEQLREGNPLGKLFNLGSLEEMTKRNMSVFQSAMRMWTSPGGDAQKAETPATDDGSRASIKELSERLNTLQSQIEKLTTKKDD